MNESVPSFGEAGLLVPGDLPLATEELVAEADAVSARDIDELRRNGIGICKLTALVVCKGCGIGIAEGDQLSGKYNTSQLRTHLRKHALVSDVRRICIIAEKASAAVLRSLLSSEDSRASRESYLNPKDAYLKPLLWAPVTELIRCRKCSSGFKNHGSYRQHLSRNQPCATFQKGSPRGTMAEAQVLYNTSKALKCVLVSPRRTRAHIVPDSGSEQAALDEHAAEDIANFFSAAASGDISSKKLAHEQACQFMERTGLWKDYIHLEENANISMEKAFLLCDTAAAGGGWTEEESIVARACDHVYSHGCKEFTASTSNVLQEACVWTRRGHDDIADVVKGIRRNVEESTTKDYKKAFKRVIVFIVRLVQTADGNFARVDKTHGRLSTPCTQAELRTSAQHLLAQLQGDASERVISTTRRTIEAAKAAVASAEGTMAAVSDAVVDLAMSSTVLPYGVFDQVYPLRMFFSLAAVERGKDGIERFTGDGNRLSKVAAGLKRATCYVTYLHVLKQVRTAGSDPEAIVQRISRIRHGAESVPGEPQGPLLALIISQSKEATAAENRQLYVDRCDIHKFCFRVSGNCMPVTQVGIAVRKAVERFDNLTEDVISAESANHGSRLQSQGEVTSCFALSSTLPSFMNRMRAVPEGNVDDRAKHDYGDSFLTIKPCQQLLTSEGKTYAGFRVLSRFENQRRDDGSRTLTEAGRRELRRWESKMNEMLRMLIVAMHLSGGGPMRATEYARLKLMGTGSGHDRDLYVVDGEVILLPHYRKNSRQNGVKLYPRVLPQEVGEMVMLWARVVMPMRTALVGLLGANVGVCSELGDNGAAFLAPVGKQVGGRALSDHLLCSLKEVGIPYGVREYRQWVSAASMAISEGAELALGDRERQAFREMSRAFMEEGGIEDHDEDGDKMDDDMNLIERSLVMQAGHSVGTALQQYAITSTHGRHGVLAGKTAQLNLSQARIASHTWHFVTGLRETMPGIDGPSTLGDQRRNATYAVPTQEGPTGTLGSAGSVQPNTAQEQILISLVENQKKISDYLKTVQATPTVGPIGNGVPPAGMATIMVHDQGMMPCDAVITASRDCAQPVTNCLQGSTLSPTRSAGTAAATAPPQELLPTVRKSPIVAPEPLTEQTILAAMAANAAACVPGPASQDCSKPVEVAPEPLPAGRIPAWNDFAALKDALQSVVRKPRATWRSRQQLIATQLSVRAFTRDVLYIAPTGEGKSVVSLVPALLEKEERLVTLVLVPYVALTGDFIARATAAGLRTAKMGESLHHEDVAKNYDILVVSMECLGLFDYKSIILPLMQKGELARIVIEEAHTPWLCKDYRAQAAVVAAQLRPLPNGWESERGLRVPAIVAVTATCPPDAVENILSECGMAIACTTVIRPDTTVRRNLTQRIVAVTGLNQALSQTQAIITDSNPGSRILIFAGTPKETEFIAGRLEKSIGLGSTARAATVAFFHGKLPSSEKEKILRDWLQPVSRPGAPGQMEISSDVCPNRASPKVRVIVATNAFGQGIDTNVTAVLHLPGSMASMVEYGQERGRAGRDGRRALCIVYVYKSLGLNTASRSGRDTTSGLLCFPVVTTSDNWKAKKACPEAGDINEWLRQEQGCRVQTLHAILDGADHAHIARCSSKNKIDGASTSCDLCEARGAPQDVLAIGDMGNDDVTSTMEVSLPDEACQTVIAARLAAMTQTKRENTILMFHDLVEEVAPTTWCGPCRMEGLEHFRHEACRDRDCGRNLCDECYSPDHRRNNCPHAEKLSRLKRGKCNRCGVGPINGISHVYGMKCPNRSIMAVILGMYWSARHILQRYATDEDLHSFPSWFEWVISPREDRLPNMATLLEAMKKKQCPIRPNIRNRPFSNAHMRPIFPWKAQPAIKKPRGGR